MADRFRPPGLNPPTSRRGVVRPPDNWWQDKPDRRGPRRGPRRGGNDSPPSDPAYKIVKDWLDQYGLGSLARWAWDRYRQLGASENPMEIIAIEMRDRDEFKERFPAYEALASQGRAWGLERIIAYENQARELLHTVDARDNYTNQEIQQWLIGGISPNELQARIGMAQRAAQESGVVGEQLRSLYGVTGNMLAQFWLDPERAQTRIEQMWRAGQLGAAAVETGFGQLSTAQAEFVAQRLDPAQGTEAFGALVQARDLFSQQVGDTEGVSTDDQIGYITGDAERRAFIERRQRSRQAAYAGSGGYGATQRGVSGLGSNSGV